MNLQLLHQTLLGCEYQYRPVQQLPKAEYPFLHTDSTQRGYYVKEYITAIGVFQIALILKSDPSIQLPTACILQIPDSCKGLLIPHVSQEHTLCYVMQMESDWDPNDLYSLYQDVDLQIQQTLDRSVASIVSKEPKDEELEGEFTAYWRPETYLFLLAKPAKGDTLYTRLAQLTRPDGTLRKEYVTAQSVTENNDELRTWLAERNFTAESLPDDPITTHYIRVKPARLAGVAWPPQTFNDVVSWLEHVDPNAADHLIRQIKSVTKKRRILLFDVAHQDMLAIYIEIDLNAVDLKRHRKTKKNSSVLKSVLKGRAVQSFKRLGVIKADHDTLLSRNLRRPGVGNLSNKRIALIGCGTIGGYLADLLLRSGAGCGSKPLHLYDGDHFSPHNFGRHSLTIRDFGKNKALSVAESLKCSIHVANHKSIKGYDEQFPIEQATLIKYDIVIDATGRPPVSKRLASVIRQIPSEEKPILIHAFNDGNGRASKVLVDNGGGCYGCMLVDPATHRNGIDLRFEKISQENERVISCGGTYSPYDAAVSQITAALAQEAVLNTLESDMPWTYNEHMFDCSRSRKPHTLKQQQYCCICNDQD